jgi:hypothetical protein
VSTQTYERPKPEPAVTYNGWLRRCMLLDSMDMGRRRGGHSLDPGVQRLRWENDMRTYRCWDVDAAVCIIVVGESVALVRRPPDYRHVPVNSWNPAQDVSDFSEAARAAVPRALEVVQAWRERRRELPIAAPWSP